MFKILYIYNTNCEPMFYNLVHNVYVSYEPKNRRKKYINKYKYKYKYIYIYIYKYINIV